MGFFFFVGPAFRLTSWTWRNGFQPHIPRARWYLIQPLIPVREKRLRQFVISFVWKRQNRNPREVQGSGEREAFALQFLSPQEPAREEEPVLEGGCGTSQPCTAQELGMLGLENQRTGWGKGSLVAAWVELTSDSPERLWLCSKVFLSRGARVENKCRVTHSEFCSTTVLPRPVYYIFPHFYSGRWTKNWGSQ